MSKRFTNVQVVTPTHIAPLDMRVDDGGRIVALVAPGAPALPGEEVIDCGGAHAFPGMIDVLTHGYGNYLYTDVEEGGVAANSRALPKHGVTAFAPSVVSHSTDKLFDVLSRLSAQLEAPAARVLGIHSEGPCISSPGAHKKDSLVAPSARLAEQMIEAANHRLAFVTLAPEMEGADGYCKVMREAGVGMHLGHSNAKPLDVGRFLDYGVTGVTHMYDVMFPATVVEGGAYPLSLADALLAEEGLALGLICDGVHVQPVQVKLLAQQAPHRLFLETDSMKFTGFPSGRFELYEGMFVTTSEDNAARGEEGGLAGSCLTSDRALRNLITFAGVDLPRASLAASLVPARLAGRAADLGSLEPGKLADIVLLDESIEVIATYVAGREVYRRTTA